MGSCLLIGVAGGTGCGKTTLISKISQEFGKTVTVLYHDNYYKKHVGMTYEERAKLNYDSPDAFDTDRMVEDLKKLKAGEAIDCPVYDFTVHNRSDKVLHVEPSPIILVDGILVLSDPRVCALLDIKVFVDTDADTRLIRRIRRDMTERKRSLESILSQYETTVKPMHDLYVEPCRRLADVVIPEGRPNDVAYRILSGSVSNYLSRAKNAVNGEE